jgi:hypothetical protein
MLRRPLVLTLLVACTADSPATPAKPVVADAPAADATTPSATPQPIVTPTPTATSTPTQGPPVAGPDVDAAPPPPAAPAGATFQLAAYRDGELSLHRVGDEVFVVGAAGLAHADARGKLVAVEYGLTGQADPEEWGTWNTLGFGGVWPGNVWLATQFDFSRGSSKPQLQRRAGESWQPVANKDGLLYWYHAPIVAWREGQVLGVRRHIADPNLETDDGGELIPRLRKRLDAQLAAARRGIELLGPTPTAAPMTLGQGMDVARLAVAPTGELFALGRGRDDATGDRARVQRWGLEGDAAVTGVVHPLAAGLTCAQIAVRSADEAYVGCTRKQRAHLVRFDGAAWTDEPGPAAPGIVDLAVAPEGELWAVVGSEDPDADRVYGQVWRRAARGAAWERVALPELRFADRAHDELLFIPSSRYNRVPADPEAAAQAWAVRPLRVIARAGGDVWISGETYLERDQVTEFMAFRSVVLRNRAVAEPLRMLADIDLRAELLDWRSAPAWRADRECQDSLPPTVFLRTLPRDAPRNQPEPAIEALVAGHPAVMPKVEGIYEFWRRGRRTIGLFVAPESQADADAILAALEQVAPGEKRTLECRWPRARREFDRTTGKPIDAPPT